MSAARIVPMRLGRIVVEPMRSGLTVGSQVPHGAGWAADGGGWTLTEAEAKALVAAVQGALSEVLREGKRAKRAARRVAA